MEIRIRPACHVYASLKHLRVRAAYDVDVGVENRFVAGQGGWWLVIGGGVEPRLRDGAVPRAGSWRRRRMSFCKRARLMPALGHV